LAVEKDELDTQHDSSRRGETKKPYLRPVIAWEDSLDVKSLAAACAKGVGQGCDVLGTVSS
jgi:hypothetical protein